jgi:hypothetical protein
MQKCHNNLQESSRAATRRVLSNPLPLAGEMPAALFHPPGQGGEMRESSPEFLPSLNLQPFSMQA